MKRRAPIQTGPRTWAMAREDYLRGDTGPVVCKRYGIRIDALRARCWREGWSKRAHAERIEIDRFGPLPETPPAAAEWGDRLAACPAGGGAEGAAGFDTAGSASAPFEGAGESGATAGSADPQRAVERAMRAAAQALAQGRALEAQALIKAAEGLTRLSSQVGPLPPPEPDWMPALRGELDLPQDEEAYAAFLDQVWTVAGDLAFDLLAEAPDAPRLHARAVYGWRARRLGPAVAARDLTRARAGGWDKGVWDLSGRVLPPPRTGGEMRAWIEAALAQALGAQALGDGPTDP